MVHDAAQVASDLLQSNNGTEGTKGATGHRRSVPEGSFRKACTLPVRGGMVQVRVSLGQLDGREETRRDERMMR